jgi:hypothetical protein
VLLFGPDFGLVRVKWARQGDLDLQRVLARKSSGSGIGDQFANDAPIRREICIPRGYEMRRGPWYHRDSASQGGFLMSKIALAIGLAGLLLATVSTTGSAMPIAPLSKSVINGSSSDLDLVRWRNCWRDRWGNRRCHWCWRDRWGRVRCG